MMDVPRIFGTNVALRKPAPASERWDGDSGAVQFSQDEADAARKSHPSVENQEISTMLKAASRVLEERVVELIGADEAALWQDADVADFMGSTAIERGVNHVTILHNDEGEEDGAQLRRRDVPGRIISISQDQYAMLQDLPFFERR
jgi:hypothetical protein